MPAWSRKSGHRARPKSACSILAVATMRFAARCVLTVPVAITYDPTMPEHASRPQRKFNLVTSFETLEHLPDPLAGLAKIIECVAEPGVVFYSTLTLPEDFDNHSLS
jgi:2-polyprenyl-3-methyl-5-hydroxy-6-metoxy-1,4-benzoquinol methylase